MKNIKRLMALVCALSLMCSICVNAEVSKSHDYDVVPYPGDTGMNIKIEEKNPTSKADFDPDGTIVKDVIFDYPDTQEGQVTVKISIPKNTRGISVYVKDGGWHKVNIKSDKEAIYVPIKNHYRYAVVVNNNGKSPKTGESTDYILLMDAFLVVSALVGVIYFYRKKEAY